MELYAHLAFNWRTLRFDSLLHLVQDILRILLMLLLVASHRAEQKRILHVFFWHKGMVKIGPSIVHLFSFSNQMICRGTNRKQIPIVLLLLTGSQSVLALLSTSPQTVIGVVLEVHLSLNAFKAVFVVINGRRSLANHFSRFRLTNRILIEGLLLRISTLS